MTMRPLSLLVSAILKVIQKNSTRVLNRAEPKNARLAPRELRNICASKAAAVGLSGFP
jgi:hypothetical protein